MSHMHTCIPSLFGPPAHPPHLNGFSVGESKRDSKEELQALLFLPDIYTDEVKLKSSLREVLLVWAVCVCLCQTRMCILRMRFGEIRSHCLAFGADGFGAEYVNPLVLPAHLLPPALHPGTGSQMSTSHCLPGLEKHNHERVTDGRQTRNRRFWLWPSLDPVADPLLVPGLYQAQGPTRKDSSHSRILGRRAPLWSHAVSATVLCKIIECCPPKPKFWGATRRPPQGTAHWDLMLLEKEQQLRARTHVHTYRQMQTAKAPSPFISYRVLLSLSAWG